MRRALFSACLIGLAQLPSVALAKGPSIWTKCDGLAQPEGAGAMWGRNLAATATMGILGGLVGKREGDYGAPLARGKEGIEACTAALADPLASAFELRKVSLLRARAQHQIEVGDFDAALADLGAARQAAEAFKNDPQYVRALGNSTLLFEAALLAKKGKYAEATTLAVQVSDTRPYSANIAATSLAIASISGVQSAEVDRVLDRFVLLKPEGLLTRAASRDRTGDINGAADDWRRAVAGGLFLAGLPTAQAFKKIGVNEDPEVIGRAALAAARAGRVDDAARFLARLEELAILAETRNAVVAPMTPKEAKEKAQRDHVLSVVAARKKSADSFKPLTEAFLLQARGDNLGAAQKLSVEGQYRFPLEPATLDLLNRLSQVKELSRIIPAPLVDAVRAKLENVRTARANELDVQKFATSLPPLNDGTATDKYRKQGFNINGYKEKKTTSGSFRTIEFVGATTIATSEELTLLRLAEIAREEGKSAFTIVGEREYTRTWVSGYGQGVGGESGGYMIEVDFKLLDAADTAVAENAGRVLSAEAVTKSLSPIYLPPAPESTVEKSR